MDAGMCRCVDPVVTGVDARVCRCMGPVVTGVDARVCRYTDPVITEVAAWPGDADTDPAFGVLLLGAGHRLSQVTSLHRSSPVFPLASLFRWR